MTDEDAVPDNALFDLYREYIGEPDTRTDVYLGFGLFFVGILLSGVGLLLFLYSGTLDYGSRSFWDWRGPAYALGMISLPTALLGINVLLPVKPRAVYAGAAGSVITFVGVVWFSVLYPWDWNTASGDASGPVVLLYGLGIAVVLASTGAALVAHQIQRYKPGPADIDPVEEEESDETISDEIVEQDIEDAMSDVDITWGGVERDEGSSLSLNVDESDIDTSGMNTDAVNVTRSTSTDTQVQGLKAMQGGEKTEARSESTVDDQTSKLTELRQRREKEQEREEKEAATQGLLAKFKSALGLS